MNILSLFDGMACGMLAFQKAGIAVDNYYAYEIDKYAVQTAKHNFPNIQELGDVFNADFRQYTGIDYLIGGSPCFTKGHYVLTDNGYKDVSEIQVGDMVLTHKNRYRKVVRTNEREANIVDVKIMGYPTFHTTAEHPFYTLERRKATWDEYKKTKSWRVFSTEPKWVKALDLKPKTHFCGQHIGKSAEINATDIDTELAYILGRYVADGHIRKSKRPGRPNSYQYQVILSIGASKIEQFKKHVMQRHYSCYEHTESVYRVCFSSMELLNFIEQQGFGKGANNKAIPEFIYNLPRDIQLAFLSGYMDGDGHIGEYQYCAFTVSPMLAFGLQRLVTQLYGVNVGVTVCNNDKTHSIGNREIHSNYPLYTVVWKESIKKQSVAHIQDGIVWTQVKNVCKTSYTDTVYNIEVEDDNSYTVNNCIVHNCTYWSIAQSPDKRETTASGIGWELFSQYVRGGNYTNVKKQSGQRMCCAEPVNVTADGKAQCLRATCYKDGVRNIAGNDIDKKTGVAEPVCMRYERSERAKQLRKDYESGAIKHGYHEYHELQPRTDGKTNTLSTVQKDNPICVPVRCFTLPREDGVQTESKQYRVYETSGKSTTLCAEGGGMGAKTGLYAVPVEFDGDIPIKAISAADGKTYTVYEVKDGTITIKSKTYPIKLVDGYYIIRKLTVSECKRLQTVPEWYEFPVSNTRAYKMLGNGWTVDVITHLINATENT